MRKIVVVLLLLGLAFIISAMQMIIHKTDGSELSVDISEIESITFAETEDPGFSWCLIPAGDYTYGEDNTIQTIDYDFEIMKYEVTYGQYLVYLQQAYDDGLIYVLNNGVHGHYPGDEHYYYGDYRYYCMMNYFPFQHTAHISYTDGEFVLNPPPGYDDDDFLDHPVYNVMWFGAWHFAEYYGLRLPTEEEWEKAARGLTGYDFPWGNEITGSRANYNNSGGPYGNGTTPVGFYNGDVYGDFETIDSPSPFGVYDMAGNVFNWTDSWIASPSGNMQRVMKGGFFSSHENFVKSWYRDSTFPEAILRTPKVGFRCVRTR